MSIQAILKPLLDDYRKNNPTDLKALNPPATTKDLDILTKTLPHPNRFPNSYIEFLKLHNGANDHGRKGWDIIFYITSWQPMSCQDIVNLHETLIAEEVEFPDHDQPKGVGGKGVRSTWYDRLWIPIMEDSSGNYLCLDFNPAAGGKKGQVITYDHAHEKREVFADSFEEALDLLVAKHIKDEEAYRVKKEEQGKKPKAPAWLRWLVD